MDLRLRELRRAALEGDPSARLHAITEYLRAGLLEPVYVWAAAHMGDEVAKQIVRSTSWGGGNPFDWGPDDDAEARDEGWMFDYWTADGSDIFPVVNRPHGFLGDVGDSLVARAKDRDVFALRSLIHLKQTSTTLAPYIYVLAGKGFDPEPKPIVLESMRGRPGRRVPGVRRLKAALGTLKRLPRHILHTREREIVDAILFGKENPEGAPPNFLELLTNAERLETGSASSWVHEIPDAVRRAIAAGAQPPLTYMGTGMTSHVFCEPSGRGFKVARIGPPGSPWQPTLRRMLADEAAWLKTANRSKATRHLVPRFYSYDPENVVIVRECLQGIPAHWRHPKTGEWMDELARAKFEELEAGMLPRGWTAPEAKTESWLFHEDDPRQARIFDASMPARVGKRLVAHALRMIRERAPREHLTTVMIQVRNEAIHDKPTISRRVARDLLDRLTAAGGDPRVARDLPPERNPPPFALHRYVSPRHRAVTPEEAWVRSIAYGIKTGQPVAIEVAARSLAPYVPHGALLVPAPSSSSGYGGVMALAQRLAELRGGEAAPLVQRTRPLPMSSHLRRRAGGRGFPIEEHAASMTLVAPPPPGREIVLVDNVAVTGATLEATRRLLGVDAPAVVWAQPDAAMRNPDEEPYGPAEPCMFCGGEAFIDILEYWPEELEQPKVLWERVCRRTSA